MAVDLADMEVDLAAMEVDMAALEVAMEVMVMVHGAGTETSLVCVLKIFKFLN